MPLTLPTELTFAAMLQKLRTRVKLHATIGDTPALKDILTEANEYVFRKLDNGLPWQSVLTLTPNVALVPFVTDSGLMVARGSVQSVWLEQGGQIRVPLPQGISHAQRAQSDLRAPPERYDTQTTDASDSPVFQLEVWPTPNAAYPLYIDHNRILARFEQDADTPSAPGRLVLAYAIAMGKAHYSQPDADAVGQAFKTMLADECSRQRENRRFIPPSDDCRRGPQVVKTSTGYTQV